MHPKSDDAIYFELMTRPKRHLLLQTRPGVDKGYVMSALHAATQMSTNSIQLLGSGAAEIRRTAEATRKLEEPVSEQLRVVLCRFMWYAGRGWKRRIWRHEMLKPELLDM